MDVGPPRLEGDRADGPVPRVRVQRQGYLTSVWDELRNQTALAYQNVAVDANDISGKWKSGRSIPHISQLTSKTDPKGTATTTAGDFQWKFTYDAKGNVLTATDPENFPETYTYNADGTVATDKDANNHTTTFASYDSNGLPTKIVDAKGQTTQFGYDSDGLLLWVQDPRHASDTGTDTRSYRSYFDYDGFHRLVAQSTPKSTQLDRGNLIWSDASYDANDNLTRIVDAHYGATDSLSGPTTTTVYDAMDQPTLVTGPDTSAEPAGERNRFTYDAAGRLTSATMPRGVQSAVDKDFTTYYSYDPLDRVVKETAYTVDGAGAITATRNTHYCYDLAGDLVSRTDPKAGLDSITCPTTAAFTTKYAYDAAHRVLSVTDPLLHKQSVTYDANDNVATATDESGSVETRSYDQRDLLVKVVDPFVAGGKTLTTKLDYDPVGNLQREINPRAWDASTDKVTFNSYVTKYVYDAVDQLTRIDLPVAGTFTAAYVHNTYDANGNLLSTSLPVTATDPAAVASDKKTVYTYLDPGWIRTAKDPATPAVHYDYAAEGWQTSRVPEDGSGNLDNGHSMAWTYYQDGLLQRRTDRDAHVSTFAYDADNNLTSGTAGIKSGTSETPIAITGAYDGFDQLTKLRQKKQTDTNWRFTTYTYDANGNVATRDDDGIEDPSGNLVTAGRKHDYAYDGADWVQSDLDHGKQAGCADDQRTTYDFTPTGREKLRTIAQTGAGCTDAAPNWQTQQTTAWTYFLNGDLNTLQTKNKSGTLVESHTVTYLDPSGFYLDGNRAKDVFTLLGPNTTVPCRTGACTTVWTYDPRDRLQHFKTTRNDTGAIVRDIDYTLDTQGNITRQVQGGVTTDLTYIGNQLETQKQNGSLVAKYFYDRGNLTCVTSALGTKANCPASPSDALQGPVTQAYFYDDLDRLQNVRSQNSPGAIDRVTDYLYDALDRVSRETETHGTGATHTTDFSYLGVSNDVTDENHTGSATTKTKSYSLDPWGDRISLTRTTPTNTSATWTYGYDVHGSVSLLLDNLGQAKAAYGYDPYGNEDSTLTQGDRINKTDPNANDPLNPYRFSGKRWDSGSATVDMGSRRFGPDTAHFFQNDLFGDALDDLDLSVDPLTDNRYALAGGNPVSFVEVDGHMVRADGGGGSVRGPRLLTTRRYRTSRDSSHHESGGGGGFFGSVWGGVKSLTVDSSNPCSVANLPDIGDDKRCLSETWKATGRDLKKSSADLMSRDPKRAASGVLNLGLWGTLEGGALKESVISARTGIEVGRAAKAEEAAGRMRWLRGSQGNAGLVPKSVARQLRGRSFSSPDDFREAFWEAAAGDPALAAQFSKGNVARMRQGLAPIAPQAQQYGKLRSYILHHRTPVARGGDPYDPANILIVTPRYHQEVLSRSYHFGQGG
ncbi:MAG TPA: RHS repeat-associated core domain-containing protein [Gaiellaceae bacterium]|nr:RHS repeat-associated core domain-containing protein [Gaiellaceae bacterium]